MQERVGEKWSSPQSSFHAKILDTTFSSQALEKEEALFSWSIMFSHVQMGGFFCMFTRSLASYGSTPFSPPPFLLFFPDGMEAQKLWLDIPNEVTFRWHFFIEAIEKRVLLKTFSIPFLIPKGF